MQKLLLVSVLIATISIPSWLERLGDTAGFRTVLRIFAVFTAMYVVALLYIYPRLF